MASWLTCGVDDNDKLISVEAVSRGLSKLRCPYCGGQLTAKKGQKLAHHFAHTEATCQDVRRRASELPTLPCYNRFNLGLTPAQLQELSRQWAESNHGLDPVRPSPKPFLLSLGLLQVRSASRLEFTDRGKIPFGAIPMRRFASEQDVLVGKREIELGTRIAQGLGQGMVLGHRYRCCDRSIQQPLIDLKLYRAQLRRVLELTLYYLKIEADGERLYKIGVTRRCLSDRIEEVRRDLARHFNQIDIKEVGRWAHRGSCELYFKQRYRSFNRPVGSLTEYFQFPTEADAEAAVADLRQLKSKRLNELERAVLAEEPSYLEQVVADNVEAYRSYERSQAIKAGMQRVARSGKTIGRSAGK